MFILVNRHVFKCFKLNCNVRLSKDNCHLRKIVQASQMANGLELNYHVTLVKYYILIIISNKDSSFISFKYAIKICKSMDLVTLHNSTPPTTYMTSSTSFLASSSLSLAHFPLCRMISCPKQQDVPDCYFPWWEIWN